MYRGVNVHHCFTPPLEFPTPIVTYSFALVNQSENFPGVVVLRVTVQVSR